jgi:hypothetical protein
MLVETFMFLVRLAAPVIAVMTASSVSGKNGEMTTATKTRATIPAQRAAM